MVHAVQVVALEQRLDHGLVFKELDRAPGHLVSLLAVTMGHVVRW